MRDPPAAPVVKNTVELSANSAITGEMDESGRLPGAMKLAGEGSKPNEFRRPGWEKSSISLLLYTVSKQGEKAC